jgi:Ni,Fe-hydrogenase III large subunit
MSASSLIRAAAQVPCQPLPRYRLSHEQWSALAAALGPEPTLALLALWADPAHVYALFHDEAGAGFLFASTAVAAGSYPALSPARPAAAWFERMVRDLWGHAAEGGRDGRPWLDHGRWTVTAPLAAHPMPRAGRPEPPEFLPVEGEDLHQIPIGPVHAGIIESGHFRFTAAGETVVRLEVRLGYAHKGTLALLRGKSPRAAARFAARLSGDSTVAHAIAFARAAEAASFTEAPPRAVALRAVMAELERIANHLGDIGAIANDAAFAFLPARCHWHREGLLRAAAAAFGHRLMMDCVVPGGLGVDIAPGGAEAILKTLVLLEAELPTLLRVYDNTSSLVDRMVGTGTVSAGLVASFAAGGFVGRAAGRGFDVRKSPGYAPYDRLDFSVPVLEEGDVDARVRIRFGEIRESIGLLCALLATLPGGATLLALPAASGEGIGWAEGFRGDIWHWLRLENGMIAAAFLRDPSWLQWPLLESAIRGNIVADFPLCNKSFNCSYSGVDL